MLKAVVIDSEGQASVGAVDWGAAGLMLAGETRGLHAAAELCRRLRPDVVVAGLDAGLAEIVGRIKQELPGTRVVAVSKCRDFEACRLALNAGVNEFLAAPANPTELAAALKRQADAAEQAARRDHARDAIRKTDTHKQLARRLAELLYAEADRADVADGLVRDGLPNQGFAVAAVQMPASLAVLRNEQIIEAVLGASDAAHMQIFEFAAHNRLLLAAFPFGRTGAAQCARSFRVALKALAEAGQVGWFTQAQGSPAEFYRFGEICNDCVEELENKIFFAGGRRIKPPVAKAAPAVGGVVSEENLIAYLSRKSEELAKADAGAAEGLIREVAQNVAGWQGESMFLLRAAMTVFAAFFVLRLVGTEKRYDDLRLDNIARQMQLKAGAAELTDYLCEVYNKGVEQQAAKSRYSLLIQTFMKYVRKYACDNFTLTQAAGALYISPNYLSTLIKKETGRSFTDILLNERIEASKKLLADPQNTVEGVGIAIGYHNYISFYKAFKKHTGQTPKEYRDGLLV